MKSTSLEVSLHIDETDHVASDEFLPGPLVLTEYLYSTV